MNAIYSDTQMQFSKLAPCNGLDVGLLFPEYFVKKAAMGENIILLIICAVDGLDMGTLDGIVAEYKTALEPMDKVLGEMLKEA